MLAEQLDANQSDILGQAIDLVLVQEAEIKALALFGALMPIGPSQPSINDPDCAGGAGDRRSGDQR